MRFGDYIISLSLALNLLAMMSYAYQGHWKNAAYWCAAAQLNFWLMRMA